MCTLPFLFVNSMRMFRSRLYTRSLRKMRGVSLLLFLSFLLLNFFLSVNGESFKDKLTEDDFDEFEFEPEEEEEEEKETKDTTATNRNQNEEETDDEFDNEIGEESETPGGSDNEDEFDSEEFESGIEGEEGQPSSNKDLPDLKIQESAVRIKPFIEAYLIEVCICLGIVLYFSNYLLGRTKNTSIAESWMLSNLPILQNEFVIVGDDGDGEEPSESHIVRRSDNSFTVWASGRVNCDSLLIHLELIKRHDLISIIYGMFRPSIDSLSFIFQLADGDMDSVVMAVSPRKTAAKMSKDYEDLSKFCSGVKSGEKYNLPSGLSILTETSDSTGLVLSGGVAKFLRDHADDLLSLHVSDQYTGLKEEGDDSDTVVVKKPEKRIHLTFKLPSDVSQTSELLSFALKLLDHIRGSKLSREAKEKTVKNRQLVIQEQEKLQHQQRQEAAQQRKEEKKKAEKEKMLEGDADKVRKWEEKEYKKQMKKSQPRMKQMKVRMG